MMNKLRFCLATPLLISLLAIPAHAGEIPVGLTLLEAGADRLAATYSSPHASIMLEAQVVEDKIETTLRDEAGESIIHFWVPILEGEDLVARYQAMAPEITNSLTHTPQARPAHLYQEASFGVVWSVVQMLEEITLRLSGSVVPREMRAAIRLHATVLGMIYEQSSARAASEQSLEKIPGIFSGDCNGACGPGCDWCVSVPFTNSYVCETSAFCVLHDAYCGAWGEFLNCDFGSCDIL